MKREIVDYVRDIVEATKNAMDFVKDLDYSIFEEDTKTVYAVIRALEIIGEACKKVPEEIRNKYRDIPWKEISGMRDKLIHSYFGVNLSLVWRVVKRDLPDLKPKFEKLLRDLESEG